MSHIVALFTMSKAWMVDVGIVLSCATLAGGLAIYIDSKIGEIENRDITMKLTREETKVLVNMVKDLEFKKLLSFGACVGMGIALVTYNHTMWPREVYVVNSNQLPIKG